MSLEIKYLRYLMFFLLLGITIIMFGSLALDVRKEKLITEEYATIEANASFNKDLLYRRWAAMHGGLYVPITENSPPNPHLEFIEDRDIITESGKKLTLVNPAYMTRQVLAIAGEQYGVKGHITSNNPIRPENKPTEWEANALASFENGEKEYFKIEEVNGEPRLNYMSPLFVEERCMKCHISQGYSVGDLRGGISVSVPMTKYYEVSQSKTKNLILSQISVYLVIISVIFFAYKRIHSEMKKSKDMRGKLVKNEVKLLIQNKDFYTLNEKYKQQNADLSYAIKQAEQSDKLKTAFLQNMSHEIRTPVNAINGFSEMLKDHRISDKQKLYYLSIIENSSDQLLKIVNDILTISSLETEQEEIHNSTFCLNELLEELFIIFKLRINQKKIELKLDLALNRKESSIYTDKTKLTHILTHLLANAVKFTPSGFIHFGYRLISDQLEFFVQDTGIGIPKIQHERVFLRFHQGDSSISRKYGGTGLGLSIAQGFVELLDGKIWILSDNLKGAELRFTIPYTPKTLIEKPFETKPAIKKLDPETSTILIAEDELYNFLFIKEILEKKNIKILHANNGEEAIEIAKSNIDIDLILMDIKMPQMDGHTATKIIKEKQPLLPIIAVSAYAMDRELEKYHNIFEEYITKPFDSEKLLSVLNKYILN